MVENKAAEADFTSSFLGTCTVVAFSKHLRSWSQENLCSRLQQVDRDECIHIDNASHFPNTFRLQLSRWKKRRCCLNLTDILTTVQNTGSCAYQTIEIYILLCNIIEKYSNCTLPYQKKKITSCTLYVLQLQLPPPLAKITAHIHHSITSINICHFKTFVSTHIKPSPTSCIHDERNKLLFKVSNTFQDSQG